MQLLRKIVDNSPNMIVLAGAGMGVDSGLPDYRTTGIYKNVEFEDLATRKAFMQKPQLAWDFYSSRYFMYERTEPHEGYQILKNLSKDKNFFIITSNVDGHFQKAGFSEDII